MIGLLSPLAYALVEVLSPGHGPWAIVGLWWTFAVVSLSTRVPPEPLHLIQIGLFVSVCFYLYSNTAMLALFLLYPLFGVALLLDWYDRG